MERAKIIITCMVAAIIYGIIHDEITAHICVEYFTVAHPPIFHTTSPSILGVAWGITATWWVALLLGVVLSFVACNGDAPKVGVEDVGVQVLLVLICAAISATIVGACVYGIAVSHRLVVPDSAIPAGKHAAFLAVWAVHLTSYTVAISGALVVILSVWRKRTRLIAGAK